MIYSGFFDDKTYYAKSLNQAIAGLISNGILGTKASNLQVKANSGMTITVKPGYCWIDGCHMLNDNDYVLTIATADGVLKRIDRIVARKDMISGNISLIILIGALSDTPVPPDIVNDGTYHDLGLATIIVNAGTTAITQDMITDTRFDVSVCGVVTGLANFIDTTDLFAQYDTTFKNFLSDLGVDDHVTVEITDNANKIANIPVDLSGNTDCMLLGIMDGKIKPVQNVEMPTITFIPDVSAPSKWTGSLVDGYINTILSDIAATSSQIRITLQPSTVAGTYGGIFTLNEYISFSGYNYLDYLCRWDRTNAESLSLTGTIQISNNASFTDLAASFEIAGYLENRTTTRLIVSGISGLKYIRVILRTVNPDLPSKAYLIISSLQLI